MHLLPHSIWVHLALFFCCWTVSVHAAASKSSTKSTASTTKAPPTPSTTAKKVTSLAPLEPRDGTVYYGAWYSRTRGDTPSLMNARLNLSLSFFQVDFDITQDPDEGHGDPTPAITDEALRHLVATGTNASAYWTIYPKGGLDSVTDDMLQDLANRAKTAVASGRGVFLRYAPEMNGNWFRYGQQPEKFIANWRHVVTTMRSYLGPDSSRVAFVWAPNSGNGYPFHGGRFENVSFTSGLNVTSDPYSIYYPGDEYVDWVGLSIYHYGSAYPWRQNVPPSKREFEGLMTGSVKPPSQWAAQGTAFGYYDFYGMFSGDGTGSQGMMKPELQASKGGKPFILAETGAVYHYGWNTPVWSAEKDFDPLAPSPSTLYSEVSRQDIKQSWWNQIHDFAQTHPQVKAVCSFEFIKPEEDTLRDFTMFGAPANHYDDVIGGFPEDDAVAALFAKDAIGWAGPASAVMPTTGTVSNSTVTGGVGGTAVAGGFVATSSGPRKNVGSGGVISSRKVYATSFSTATTYGKKAFQSDWEGDLSVFPLDRLPTIKNGLLLVQSPSIYQQLTMLRPDLINMNMFDSIKDDLFNTDNLFLNNPKYAEKIEKVMNGSLIQIAMRQCWMDEIRTFRETVLGGLDVLGQHRALADL
ncbi:hypothetical protein HDU76_005144, partial [Blyttiomyces sp. JEL0837]